MIGSLMSRMADAEKLSVPQLNQAIKNGTIPAYVGVPLIQEKLRAEQAAKAVVAQTQAQPPIARQVMEEADAMTGLEKLRSNLPEEGFAGGGIVAFAQGGLGLPENDEDDEDDKLFGKLMAGLASVKSSMPESYEAELAKKGQTPASARKLMIEGPKKGDYVMPPLDKPERSFRDVYKGRGGHKYEGMVVAEAERIGLDPNIALHALYKETGGLKNPESARSRAGALGVMQLMPKTAKELGVDPLNPEENIRGGVMYLKQMYDKYQDPTLTLAAYNAGPGRVDRALKSGQGIAALPRETRNYVVASNRMAGGGIVAFQDGGISGEFGGMAGTTADDTVTVPTFEIDPMTGEKLFSGYRSPIKVRKEPRREPFGTTQPRMDVAPLPMTSPTDAELGRTTTKEEAAPTPTGPSALDKELATPDSGLADIRNLLKQRMEESGKQKRIDAYLSLIQTGLGMMGGTSPYAAVNIGQGAGQGIAAQMAARKAQVAEENAIMSGQLGLSRAELYDKIRRDTLKQQTQKTAADRGLAERRLGVQQQALNVRMGQLRRQAGESWDASAQKTQIEADLAKQKKNWRQDPKLLGQYNMMRNRFINEIIQGEQAGDALSATDLLQ